MKKLLIPSAILIFAFALFLIYRYQGPQAIRHLFQLIDHKPDNVEKPVETDYIDLSQVDPSMWVTHYDPLKASNGYNLVFYKQRIPMLIGMNGNIVHYWPNVKATDRIRLTPEGNLLTICPDNVLREYNWDGELVWQFKHKKEKDFPHHDLIRLTNGNTLVLYMDMDDASDYILEVNDQGEVVWKWHIKDYIDKYFNWKIKYPNDKTHVNSVRELPPNKMYEKGNLAFKPGNILISARNISTVFIIDKETKDIVWQYDEGLDNQHEALMIEKGQPGEGNILVFNNGLRNLYHFRRSNILEIDPSEKLVVWQYSSRFFYSEVGGVEQNLPNGNVVITSSSIFEINRGGEIVWQWAPPFQPLIVERYPYDYCHQFEAMGRPLEEPINPNSESIYVDANLHRIVQQHELFVEDINGKNRAIVRKDNFCHPLTIPENSALHVGFGLDKNNIERDGLSDYSALFTVKIRPYTIGEEFLLIREIINPQSDSLWINRTIPLDEYAYKEVLICFAIEDNQTRSIEGKSHYASWEFPGIQFVGRSFVDNEEELNILTNREKKIRRLKLRTLGYVN
jgi:hypothetical protein